MSKHEVKGLEPELVLWWGELIKERGLKLTALSRKIGAEDSFLSSRMSLARKALKNGGTVPEPRARVCLALANALGLTVPQLLREQSPLKLFHDEGVSVSQDLADEAANHLFLLAQEKLTMIGMRVPLDNVLRWWRANNGRLEGYDRLIESFDLLNCPEPDDLAPKAIRVGAQSLCSKLLGYETGRLQKVIDLLPDDQRRDLAVSYRQAGHSQGPIITQDIQMSIKSPSAGIMFESCHWRLQLPVVDKEGNRQVINYSF